MQIQKYPISFFEKNFKKENNSRVKQRLQLLIYLREERNMRNAAELLRISLGSVPYWKQRFEEEGLTGLQDRKGRGRKSDLSVEQLKKIESAIENGIKMKDGYKRGFKTKDVREFIKNNFGRNYTPRNCLKIIRKMRFNLKVPRPRNKSRNQDNVDEFKVQFKKKLSSLDKDTIVVTYDQAHFTIDADVRKVWAKIGTTPILYKNGSKKGINVGGAYSSTGEFLSYEMERQVQKEVLWNIKLIRMKFPKMLLLLDKARWNKNKFVMSWLEENKIQYMFFPTGASDLNPVEECWRQTRDNVTDVSHNSEEELSESLKYYWNKQPFTHNVFSYLVP